MRGRQQQISGQGVTIRLAAHAVRATPQRRIEEPAVRPLTLTSDGQFWKFAKGRRRWCLYHLHLGLSRQTDGAQPRVGRRTVRRRSATSHDVTLGGGQWALAAHVAPLRRRAALTWQQDIPSAVSQRRLWGFGCSRRDALLPLRSSGDRRGFSPIPTTPLRGLRCRSLGRVLAPRFSP
ncbi:hypothetical protein HPB50_001911 [Hyalomma asiaticum]|uniref:Uncharacterized protein n=1 Tax=Hyalomma asiaticum TaxID=266040 RepID=A0ACB7TAX8_HYAAI|nr:hypothetical protein HPB50_001911 [Hyalomma asiaticum]